MNRTRIDANEIFLTNMGGKYRRRRGRKKKRPLRQWQVFEFERHDEELRFGRHIPDQFGRLGRRILGRHWLEGEKIAPVLAPAAAGKIHREAAAILIEQPDRAADGLELV